MSVAPVAADLIDQAVDTAGRAYAPYSNFHVGAVVVAEDGSMFAGANVENAAYGSTICAEGAAIAAAATAGVRKITAVAVACTETMECYPCGNCRQLMLEFGVDTVIVQAPDGSPRIHPLGELLPHSFGPASLGPPAQAT
jgi:cytidine deaminase